MMGPVGLLLVLLISAAISPQPAAAQTGDESPVLTWSSTEFDSSRCVAWGDYDGDGDLDLAVANVDQPNRLYRNEGGMLTTRAVWSSAEADATRRLAWGDYDGDGDLDLVVGNEDENQPNRLYRNDGGTLTTSPVWSSVEDDVTYSVAWGDYDGDGDLDLAVGNDDQPDRLYRNDDGTLTISAVWSSIEIEANRSVAWGDYDGDGDLDLAVGNSHQPNRLYRNDGGSLTTSAVWSSDETDATRSVAWGDYDGDGDLDLAVGNGGAGQLNRLYRNDGGSLTTSAVWSSVEADSTQSVAWADYDGDGDLDLAAGNSDQPNRLYRNDGGALTTSAAWSIALDNTYSIAWGDHDGDGDLDLAVGNRDQPNRLYRNDGALLTTSTVWSCIENDSTRSVAWGDYDGDGDLDLAVGSWDQSNRLYRNDNGAVTTSATWSSNEVDNTFSVAWGDYDSDGDLDLAVGNRDQANRLYHNAAGALTTNAGWSCIEADSTESVAWGDYDGDGDLDLAVANLDQPNRLYRNDKGSLTTIAAWSSIEADASTDLAWGDYDGDGDLDLAVGNAKQPNRLYLNDGGALGNSAVWSSVESDNTQSVAWGDYDGDGDLDLMVGNWDQPNQLYRNDDGALTTSAVWLSVEADDTRSLSWGDYDGDGDLDLAAGNYGQPNRLYRNDGEDLTTSAVWSSALSDHTNSVAWGDYDGDGDLDLAAGNSVTETNRIYHNLRRASVPLVDSPPYVTIPRPGPTAGADFFSTPYVLSQSQIAIPFHLSDHEGDSANVLFAEYSLNGGGQWRPAVAASGTVTTNLHSGALHTFVWDTFKGGVMGQSDNAAFRLVVAPVITSTPDQAPGPYLFGSTATNSLPFRVRGSQVRVLSGTAPISNAVVYRLPAGQAVGAQPYTDLSGKPFRTDNRGYLQGRGQIATGDQLVALLPVTSTASYELYHTSATPTTTGLHAYTVTQAGVHTLTVSSDNPLVLFDLDVALEWDARQDTAFLEQLQFDLLRTSELLYDWSNAQAALGQVTVFHDREQWLDAHVRIYATNRMRPNANQGGIVSQVITDPLVSNVTYAPGQVHMGAVWNRYGEPSDNMGEDWPRTLAHELGHYLFFLDDNYLGLDEAGQLIPVDTCTGTAMSDPYREDYSEFHPDAGWLPDCERTLSHQSTGRSDWATITTFYPWLDGTTTNVGPSGLPLAVTRIKVVEPITPTRALEVPVFYLTQEGHRVQPGASARAFLFQDDWVTDLGRPTVDQVLARGAQPGDRACVYELSAQRLGCEIVTPGDEQLELVAQPNWQPEVIVSPVTSRTVAVTVTNIPAGLMLKARLFPVDDPAPDATSLGAAGEGYAGSLA